MSLVILPQSIPTNACIVAYDNLLELGEVTASSENADYPVENVFDWLDVDYFKPAATGTVNVDLTLDEGKRADYLAIYAHTLHVTGGTIKLQYHDGSGYVDASDTIAPTTGAPLIYQFNEVTATQWRVVITTGSTIPVLGVVSFGKKLVFRNGVYMGYSPPRFARANTYVNSVSEGGSFLGRSIIARASRTSLTLQYAPDSWVREYWDAFVEHAEGKPFFYLWNPRDYPMEAAFCWVEGDIPPPTHTHHGFMGTTINIRAKTE